MRNSGTPGARRARRLALAGIAGVTVLTVAACGSGRTDSDEDGGAAGMRVGTTDKIFSLDPAAAYDNGSYVPETNIYAHLLNFAAGETTPEPDLAEKCEFTTPVEFTCTLQEGLTFANGNELTASDVKFSFDRMVAINDPNGPASLLVNLEKTEVVNDLTVQFTLTVENDQTFAPTLATQAGPIVDEDVFPADKVLTDEEVVAANPFNGPYSITSYDKNVLVEYTANPDYAGIQGAPETDKVSVKYYAGADNMKLDLETGALDVGYRSFSPTDIEGLRGNDNLTVHEGAGGELRYIVFNLNTMPGETPEQKLAVRKAMAYSIDRDALASNVYKDTFSPAYSPVPPGFTGAIEPFKDIYGATPDADEAEQVLQDAEVSTPVPLALQYNPDHYGPSSDEEYAAVKQQLEATGLFEVDLQATEWVSYQEERARDGYPLYQLGWYPDYPDADNYLTPFFAPNNFLQSHFEDDEITELLAEQSGEPDPAKRQELIETIQRLIAEKHIPTLPLLAGKQIAVAGNDVQGVESTLDPSYKFRYGALSK